MTEETQEAVETVETGAESTPSYFLAEGVAGEGDKPDWLNDKYKTVADQAKGYSELYKLHTSKQPKAPEAYETNLPEGVELNADDPLYNAAVEYAKNADLPQDKFDGLIQMYVEHNAAQAKADEDYVKAELEKLPNAGERIGKIQNFLNAQIPDQAEALSEAITTAAGVEALEGLIGKLTNKPLTAQGDTPKPVTQGDIEALMSEKDQDGKVIYKYSRERQKLVRQKIEQMHGAS